MAGNRLDLSWLRDCDFLGAPAQGIADLAGFLDWVDLKVIYCQVRKEGLEGRGELTFLE